MANPQAFDSEIAAYEAVLARRQPLFSVGAEPTFTDRLAESPEWTCDALGGDKEQRAQKLAAWLAADRPHAVVLRSVGRQYPGEPLPRWSIGLLSRRDGKRLWAGPPDPLQLDQPTAAVDDSASFFWRSLRTSFEQAGWRTTAIRCAEGSFPFRLAAHQTDTTFTLDETNNARLRRPSLHSQALPLEGANDSLAAQGVLLFLIGNVGGQITIELPALVEVAQFQSVLALIGDAAVAARLDHLVVGGFPPPVDASVAWTTLTPDPAVIEVNMAPAPTLPAFLDDMRLYFGAAAAFGLAPLRYFYNGHIADSGGGGHITLGGTTPQGSPFLVYPMLLPKLITYFNRHPSLSYLFAVDHAGSSGQSPRIDEGLSDTLDELQLALHSLAARPGVDAQQVWATLSPFLTDHTGNTHRCELNVEKLANPYLPGRGQLGLIEFRAVRMAHSPEWATAVAALLRAICTMLIDDEGPLTLHHFGNALHDRFALPWFLREDLEVVLADLARSGLTMPAALSAALLDTSRRLMGSAEFRGYRIEIRRGIHFWPLVGNVAEQERGASRLVDASVTHIEVTVRSLTGDASELERPALYCGNYRIPLRPVHGANGALLVIGLRYRTFQPLVGLHPLIKPLGPLQLTFALRDEASALTITLHDWRPDNGAYAGLPHDDRDAAARRRQRFVVEHSDAPRRALADIPAYALAEYSVDLRALPAAE